MSAMDSLIQALETQITELSDSDLKGEDLDAAIRRAEGISKVGAQMIAAGGLVLRAEQLRLEHGPNANVPKMLTND